MGSSAERRGPARCLVPVLLALLGLSLAGSAGAESSVQIPVSTYAAQLAAAQARTHSCAAAAPACDAEGVPGREQVEGALGGTFTVTWVWLSDALSAAKTAKAPERVKAMEAADEHLRLLAAESGQGAAAEAVPAAEFGQARAAANAALARDEFRSSEGPSWIQRRLARLQDWILRLFSGMDRLGHKAPWLAPVIEWGCFGLAVAGLLYFVQRNLARQALRITLTEGAMLSGTGGRETADWERLAQEQAAVGAWREAVHSMYWAGIALLEARRAWRPNLARTPREYLRLLQPDSESQRALRELTRALERVWYGAAVASERQYTEARASLEALRAAKAERAAANAAPTAAPATAGGL